MHRQSNWIFDSDYAMLNNLTEGHGTLGWLDWNDLAVYVLKQLDPLGKKHVGHVIWYE
jgi:hypothetical protein